MSRWLHSALALALAHCLLAVSAHAEDAAIEAEAITALERMGAYLRTLQAYRVEAITTSETVLLDGQKIQSENRVDSLVRPPDRLRIHTNNDHAERMYFYDGKHFSLWGERLNYYATIDAPPTVTALADALEREKGLELPLIDLFYWGTDEQSLSDITGAQAIGPSVIAGTTCELFIFREKDIDWQIWIQRGAYPLPRKLVITTKTDDARPQFSAVYHWDLAPSFNDESFVFEPPPGAYRVKLADDLLTNDSES